MLRLLSFVFCLLPFTLPAQSPWTRSKAGFYAQASWQFISSYSSVYGAGEESIQLPREVSENAIQLYGEYGISKRTTLLAAIPVVFNKRGALNPEWPYMAEQVDSGTIAGLGNTQLGVRYQFSAEKIAFAGTLRMGLPVSNYQANTGLSTGYDALTVLPMLSAGMGFGNVYWFAYGGYGFRTNNYSHFINAGVEGGIHFWRIWLIAFSDYTGSLENGSRPQPLPDVYTGLYVNDQGWLSVGLKSIVEFNRFWGLNLSGAGAIWGQYVPQRPAFSIGTYFKWD